VDDLADAALFSLERWQPAITASRPDPLQFLTWGTGLESADRELAGLVAEAVG